jgi:hypothetical protein
VICFRAQQHFQAAICDKVARRANQQNLSMPSRKNIPLNLSGKSAA